MTSSWRTSAADCGAFSPHGPSRFFLNDWIVHLASDSRRTTVGQLGQRPGGSAYNLQGVLCDRGPSRRACVARRSGAKGERAELRRVWDVIGHWRAGFIGSNLVAAATRRAGSISSSTTASALSICRRRSATNINISPKPRSKICAGRTATPASNRRHVIPEPA